MFQLKKTKSRLALANSFGIDYFCHVGLDLKTNQVALKIVKFFVNSYSACRFHHTIFNDWNDKTEAALLQLLKDPKVIAIGEIGLDYFHTYTNSKKQKEILKKQFALAEKTNKPVLLHIREAYKDTLEIVKQFNIKGIVHCFSRNLEDAETFIQLGFMISFSGVLIFHNAQKLQAIAKVIPLQKIVLETDASYLTPMPKRGKVNQPEYLKYTA